MAASKAKVVTTADVTEAPPTAHEPEKAEEPAKGSNFTTSAGSKVTGPDELAKKLAGRNIT